MCCSHCHFESNLQHDGWVCFYHRGWNESRSSIKVGTIPRSRYDHDLQVPSRILSTWHGQGCRRGLWQGHYGSCQNTWDSFCNAYETSVWGVQDYLQGSHNLHNDMNDREPGAFRHALHVNWYTCLHENLLESLTWPVVADPQGRAPVLFYFGMWT